MGLKKRERKGMGCRMRRTKEEPDGNVGGRWRVEGGGTGHKGGVRGAVEDGNEGSLSPALRSSCSLAQSRVAIGFSHPSPTSGRSQSLQPPLNSAWETSLGRHTSLAKLADPASLRQLLHSLQNPAPGCCLHEASFNRQSHLPNFPTKRQVQGGKAACSESHTIGLTPSCPPPRGSVSPGQPELASQVTLKSFSMKLHSNCFRAIDFTSAMTSVVKSAFS